MTLIVLPLSVPIVIPQVQLVGPKGKVSLDLILDTGATLTTLFSDIPLRLIGYETTNRPTQRIVTGNGIVQASHFHLQQLIVGTHTLPAFEILYYSIPGLSPATQKKIRGVLGLNFLQNFRTVLDFQQGLLELS